MRSGGGVLGIAAAQLVVGLVLLGIYEGYKKYYYNRFMKEDFDAYAPEGDMGNVTITQEVEQERVWAYENPLDTHSPMGFIFYQSLVNNVFAVCGLAGVINAQRELVIAFFVYNAAQMVFAFHFFVDLCTDAGISYNGEPGELTAYEKAAAVFMFLNFFLSVAATVFAIKAIEEIKTKQREEYNRISVLSDSLPFEADRA